jgi:hypothetical protein
MKFMESLRFHHMAWAAQTVNGETAITMAENRASRLREADARDNEAMDKAIKNFLAYEARILHLVSRACRRFRDHFNRGDCSDRDRFEEAAKDLHSYMDEAKARVDDWYRHMEDDRERMCWERQDRHAQVARLDLLEQEEESHRDELARARDDSIKMEEESHRSELARACDVTIQMSSAEADSKPVQTSLADEEEDRIAEADSKPLEASKADEGSQDLKITQGMDDQEGNTGWVFFCQFKILAAMLEVTEQHGAMILCMLDGPRATRCIQDALLWIYDPGGQLVV